MKIQTKHFSYQREPHFEGLYALSFSFSKNWGMIGLDLGKHTSNLILWRPKGSW